MGAAAGQPAEHVLEAGAPFELVDESDAPTCAECFMSLPTGKPSKGLTGDCASIPGCSSQHCDFCTNAE